MFNMLIYVFFFKNKSFQVEYSATRLAIQHDTPDHSLQLKAIITTERNKIQQQLLAAKEKQKQLRVSVAAHGAKAVEELTVAKTQLTQLKIQDEILEKSTRRMASIDVLLDI